MNCDGLSFFPHETVLSDGVRIVQSKFGIVGYGVIFKLYERIFSCGYYAPWNDRICHIFALEDCRLKSEVVDAVVKEALSEGVFDFVIFEKYGVLTSREIQEKFYHVAKKREKINIQKELWLLESDFLRQAPKAVGRDETKDSLFNRYEKAQSDGRIAEFIAGDAWLCRWLDFMDSDVVVEAINICISKNKKSVDYLKGILSNFKERGIVYVSELRTGKRDELPSNVRNSTFRNYPTDGKIGEEEKEIIRRMMANGR